MVFGARAKQAVLGFALGSLAIAGCAGMTHSMDVKGDGHGGMDHGSMDHDTMPNQGNPMVMEGQETGADHGHGGMHHGSLEIPAGQPVPQLKLMVEPDTKAGWNLKLEIANFEFAPERVNQTSLVTEGHAHLFINGEKVTRLYGPWYYIPSLPEGEHELRVELNANGHETLTAAGKPIEATVKVAVPAPEGPEKS